MKKKVRDEGRARAETKLSQFLKLERQKKEGKKKKTLKRKTN